ncbi:MAG: RHS repeat-associated core domain-containing protein [Fimbriimonadaceae bacterium]|nr:RHS repeat-associated core domain-containing protein [Fimbriimonadaceae bacterium]
MFALDGSVAHERTYGPRGDVVSSSGSPPQQGYCANLGHRQDAESSLVYMRARYYEPTTGRFLSEDPARDGTNWYAYCGSDPVNYFDADGTSREYFDNMTALGVLFLCFGWFASMGGPFVSVPRTPSQSLIAAASFGLAAFYLSEAISETRHSDERFLRFFTHIMASAAFLAVVAQVAKLPRVARGITATLIFVTVAYSLTVLGLILRIQESDFED